MPVTPPMLLLLLLLPLLPLTRPRLRRLMLQQT
jgi:hypothetical protein